MEHFRNNGDPAKVVRSVDADGFRILSKPDPRSSRSLLLSKKPENWSFFPQGSQLNFCKTISLGCVRSFSHPKFVDGANPVRRPFMAQVNGLEKTSNGLALNLGGDT